MNVDPWLKAGGPAFPSTTKGCGGVESSYRGMSLRDYFAGQALRELLSSEMSGGTWRPEEIAARSYSIADAMLEAREK